MSRVSGEVRVRDHKEKERLQQDGGRQRPCEKGEVYVVLIIHAGRTGPEPSLGAYLTLVPIQIHVVRTVIQRLIEDCRAAVTGSERTRDMVTKQQGAPTPAPS